MLALVGMIEVCKCVCVGGGGGGGVKGWVEERGIQIDRWKRADNGTYKSNYKLVIDSIYRILQKRVKITNF